MQKPIVLERQDFLADIVAIVNKYGLDGLPMFVMNDILNEVNREVLSRSQQQYETARKQYEEVTNGDTKTTESDTEEN